MGMGIREIISISWKLCAGKAWKTADAYLYIVAAENINTFMSAM